MGFFGGIEIGLPLESPSFFISAVKQTAAIEFLFFLTLPLKQK